VASVLTTTLKDVLILPAGQARALGLEVPEAVASDAYVALRRSARAGLEYVGTVGVAPDLSELQAAIEETLDVLLEPDEREPGPPDAPPSKGKKAVAPRWAPMESPSTVHPRGQVAQAWQSELRDSGLALSLQDALLDTLHSVHTRMVGAADAYARIVEGLHAGDALACIPALDALRSEVRDSWRLLGELVGERSAHHEVVLRQLADLEAERDGLEKETDAFAEVRATYYERVRQVRALLDQALGAPVERTPFEEELDLALRDLEDLMEDPDRQPRNDIQAHRYAAAMKGTA
jgi:hypothetical protein